MNQSREVAIMGGFIPGEDIDLLWSMQGRLEQINDELKEMLPVEQAEMRAGDRAWGRYGEDILKLLGAYNELQPWIRMLDKSGYWYCARCGFLDNSEVSFDEKCTLCGGNLPI